MTVERLDAQSVIDRLQRLLDEVPEAIIAFDGDGTLWSGDIGEDVFEEAVAADLIRDEAVQQLTEVVRSLGRPLSDTPRELANEIYGAYRLGQYSVRQASEMMVWCYAGWSPEELQDFARAALRRRRIDDRFNDAVRSIVEFSHQSHARAVVISASPQLVVEQATGTLGFFPEDVIAGHAKIEAGRIQARLAGPLPYAEAKVHAGRAAFGEKPWLASFGDSDFDLAMLKEARLAVAVGRRAELLEALPHVPQAVILCETAAVQ